MSLNFNFLTYHANNKTMIGNISIIGSEFETGKNEYTFKVSGRNSNGSDTFIYKITSNNGNMPSLVIGGDVNRKRPWGCLFFGSWGSLDTHVVSESNMPTGLGANFNWSLFSHVGDDIFASTRLIGTGVINGGSITEGSDYIEIEADFPIFIGTPERVGTDANYIQYMPTQDSNLLTYTTEISINNVLTNIDKAANYINIVNSISTDQTYFINSTLKVNGHVTNNKGYCFQILPDAKICLYQDDSATGDASPNLHLMISQYPCLVKRFTEDDSHYTETSSPELDYWHSGYWRDLDTGVNYTGVCSTNIPIFRGQQNAQKYLDGELSESDALNGGSFANKDSSIGGELTGSDIPTVNLSASGVGCYTYAVSEVQIKEIMSNYLFTDNSSLQQTIKDALWTWGNNPIDFMIDCYYVPFSISAFYDTINANLKFGTYQFPNTSYPAVKESNGNRLTLFNTTFEGVYGDWRDFTQFTYDLYLPFVGFFTLDNYKYLNHTVKCEMMFDLSTHNVRYYLFVDGIITDRVDGSVGVNIPLMATDTVNKAKHDRETKYSLINDSLKLAGSVGQLATGDIGGAASGVNAVISGIKKYEDLQTKPSSSVEGSFSSSMNIYDISYAYLRITEKQLILPDKLNQLYNYPSYYMGSASQLSGYCEISDIRLNGFTGTVDEMEQLKRDLMEGVIL